MNHCIKYGSTNWDTENNCFSDEPGIVQKATGYYESTVTHCHCFQITWEVKRNMNQRSLSHVSMDIEGVRSGKLEVQVPYFLAASHIADMFMSFIDEKLLDAVIENN